MNLLKAFIVFKKPTGFLLSLVVATPILQGATILLGPATRNGSFEDGVLSPWTSSANEATVLKDSSLASQGEWYACLSETAISSSVRPSIFLTLDAAPADGLDFLLSLDARNGSAAFNGLRVFFAAQNGDTAYVLATNTFFTPISSEWQAFGANFQLPEVWDGGGTIFLGLQFENFSATQGATYTGYLDNIVLQQVPEPSILALLSAGGSLFTATLIRRERSRTLRYAPRPPAGRFRRSLR